MKKSKHCPKRLPPNQVGLYGILDPHQIIELNLVNWYENLVLYVDLPPSDMLWGDIFSYDEIFAFSKQVIQLSYDFDMKAYRDLKYYLSLYKDKSNVFSNEDFLQEMSNKVATYKSLMSIRPRMEEIMFKQGREGVIREKYREKCVTPGQPEKRLLKMLIMDLESVCNKYFPDSKQNKPFRSVLAFYLAKQDIFDNLKCDHNSKALLCSKTDCMTIRRQNCKDTIKIYMKKVGLDPDRSSTVLLCKKNFTYVNCKRCINSFVDQTAFDRSTLFLRTPCQLAIGHYNDILERIKEDKNSGQPRAIDIRKIKEFQEELQTARLNSSKKDITAIYDKLQKLYRISRKKIQRILS